MKKSFPIMQDKKTSWAIDIDDLLAPTALEVMQRMIDLGYFSEMNAKNLKEKYDQPGLVPQWLEKKAQEKINEILSDKIFLINLPVNKEGLTFLRESNLKINCYITSRLNSVQKVTEKWLENNNFPKARVISRMENEKRQNWKLNYLMENKIEVDGLIDDNFYAFLGIKSNLKKIWLHNSREKPSDDSSIIHCRNFAELEIFIYSQN